MPSVVCAGPGSLRMGGDHPTPVVQAPTADQPSGRGLWLASHLVDDLTIEVTPDTAIVRLHLSRTGPTQAS